MELTNKQKEAIGLCDCNSLIIACAGSGKTTVVSEKIAKLVVDNNIEKSSIIAFTFTERAASELKARIRKCLLNKIPDDPSLGDMYVGTIHSFCLKLLKDIAPNYRNFDVMDEEQQMAFITSNYYYNDKNNKGIGLDKLRPRTRREGYWDTIHVFTNTLNVIHQNGIGLDEIDDPILQNAIERYRDILRNKPNYFFDFNAIIDMLIELLESDADKLEEVRAKFDHLIVDEYQDIDPKQERLIKLLSDNGKRLLVTAVGDDDQSIYEWRGADIKNILNFEKNYPNVKKVELVDNFRSTHAIVDIANEAIREIPLGKRLPKNMQAQYWNNEKRQHEELLADYGDIVLDKFSTDEEEAEWVASRIKELRGTIISDANGETRALDYCDMSILMRSVKNSGQIFIDKLKEKNIPCVVKGAGGLFSQDEIILIQATFCQLANVDMYYRTDTDLNKITIAEGRELIREKINLLRKRDEMPKADGSVFLEWVEKKRGKLEKQKLPKELRGRLSRRIYPQHIFHEMLNKLGIASGNEPWSSELLYNFGRFSKLLTNFETVHQWITPYDLPQLCFYMGGWAASRVDVGGLDELSALNAVQIMTVHAAKGLEWPVVFIPRVSSMLFPSSRRNQGPETFLSETIFRPKLYASGDNGERRLWYVALTRCRKFLNITSQDRLRKRPTPYYKDIIKEPHHCILVRGKPDTVRQKDTPSPPEHTALLQTTYSELNYFWECPADYQLRALMNFSPGVIESYGYGEQIHNILAEIHYDLLHSKKHTEESIRELVEERFNLRYTQNEPLDLMRKAAKLSINRYFLQYGLENEQLVVAEKDFEFLDESTDTLITGAIDLLEEIKDGNESAVCVIDFKTHTWKAKELYKQQIVTVTRQLQLYAAAVAKALPFSAEKARVHFLSPKGPTGDAKIWGKEVVDIDVSKNKQDKVLEEVRKAVKDIRAGIKTESFDKYGTTTGRCRKCDFNLICSGFNKWREKDVSSPHPVSPEESIEIELKDIEREINAGS